MSISVKVGSSINWRIVKGKSTLGEFLVVGEDADTMSPHDIAIKLERRYNLDLGYVAAGLRTIKNELDATNKARGITTLAQDLLNELILIINGD